MAEQWKVGDMVRLKSGGAVMTVETPKTHDDRVACVWYVHFEEGKVNRDSFPADTLERFTRE